MKKHYGFMLFFVGLISIGWTVCSQAMELIPVTSFDSSWVIDPYGTGTGTVTTDGAKVNLSFQGAATGEGEIDFYKTTGVTGLIGMWATLRVDQATTGSNGDCSIAIVQNVGKIGNSKIQLKIALRQRANKKSIVFRVRATDLTTNVRTVLYFGNFGDEDGGWAIGDSRTVAFARVGSEFWFYVVGSPGLIKVQAFDKVTTYNGSPCMFAWAVAGSSVAGSVSDIYLIKE
jgi:hypothetical protein